VKEGLFRLSRTITFSESGGGNACTARKASFVGSVGPGRTFGSKLRKRCENAPLGIGVVYELSPDFLWYDGFSTWINVIYNRVPGFIYDENHKFWVDGLPEHFIDAVKVTPRSETALQHPYDLEDFLLPDNFWGVPVFIRDSTEATLDSPILEENFTCFKNVVNIIRSFGVKVVVAVYPQHPGYAQTGAFGVYGPRRSYAKDIIDSVKKMDVILFDENKFGAHDYTDKMAYNVDHLSTSGAKQFTHRLDSLLSKLSK